MPWTEISPDDPDSLFLRVRELVNQNNLYRGQTNIAWDTLSPTLLRAFQLDHRRPSHTERLVWEVACITEFRKQGKMHLSPTEVELARSVGGALILMQHYGGPTRLLDWTVSPWIAAYFAANDHLDQDGLIWIISRSALISKQEVWQAQINAMTMARNESAWAEAAFTETHSVCQFSTLVDNPRMNAQQSVLTMGGSLCVSQEVALEQMLRPQDLTKLIVRSELKNGLLKQLHAMNINRYTLFGGISGIAAHLAERVSRGIGLQVSASLLADLESRSRAQNESSDDE